MLVQETYLKSFEAHAKQIAGSEHSVHHESDEMKKIADYVSSTILLHNEFSRTFYDSLCDALCFFVVELV